MSSVGELEDKDGVVDGFEDSELEEQGVIKTLEGDNSDDIQEVPQTDNSATNMSRMSAKIEPPTFVS